MRKLLMHKREIVNLFSKTKQDGYSVIPLAVYFKSSRVKVEIGLCRAKSCTISVTVSPHAMQNARWTK